MSENNLLHFPENEAVEQEMEDKKELTEDELEDFYEEYKDAIDLLGGLDAFESLMNLDDDSFNELRPSFIELFKETLEEATATTELHALINVNHYTVESAQADFALAVNAIQSIDFLSQPKKDFLCEIYSLATNKLIQLIGSEIIEIPCQLEEGVQLPTYAHETDAGLDIYAREEITINPGETRIIGTGIRMAIPEGYAILIQPRSGQSAKTKLRVANTPGLIDSGYRDEVGVIIENIEPPFKDIDYEFDDKGEIHIKSILHGEAYTIAPGQRFAQMRLVKVPKANFVEVKSVSDIGEDRQGGFGSTDISG